MSGRAFFQRSVVFLSVILALGMIGIAKGAASVRVSRTVTVGNAQIPAGEYSVRWNGEGSDTAVTFHQGRQAVATLRGKLVQRDAKSRATGVVYTSNSDGSATLTEIRFAGRREVLVFEG